MATSTTTSPTTLKRKRDDIDTLNNKDSKDKRRASALSKQLHLRLKYARLKLDHGWEKQNLNEVENLYFHHRASSSPLTPPLHTSKVIFMVPGSDNGGERERQKTMSFRFGTSIASHSILAESVIPISDPEQDDEMETDKDKMSSAEPSDPDSRESQTKTPPSLSQSQTKQPSASASSTRPTPTPPSIRTTPVARIIAMPSAPQGQAKGQSQALASSYDSFWSTHAKSPAVRARPKHVVSPRKSALGSGSVEGSDAGKEKEKEEEMPGPS